MIKAWLSAIISWIQILVTLAIVTAAVAIGWKMMTYIWNLIV